MFYVNVVQLSSPQRRRQKCDRRWEVSPSPPQSPETRWKYRVGRRRRSRTRPLWLIWRWLGSIWRERHTSHRNLGMETYSNTITIYYLVISSLQAGTWICFMFQFYFWKYPCHVIGSRLTSETRPPLHYTIPRKYVLLFFLLSTYYSWMSNYECPN